MWYVHSGILTSIFLKKIVFKLASLLHDSWRQWRCCKIGISIVCIISPWIFINAKYRRNREKGSYTEKITTCQLTAATASKIVQNFQDVIFENFDMENTYRHFDVWKMQSTQSAKRARCKNEWSFEIQYNGSNLLSNYTKICFIVFH